LANNALAHRRKGTVRHVFHRVLGHAAEVAEHRDCNARVTRCGQMPSFTSQLINDRIHDCIAPPCGTTFTRSEDRRNARDIAATQISLRDGAAVRHGSYDPEEASCDEFYARLAICSTNPHSRRRLDAHGPIDKCGDGIGR
jgi:hypothetical protein